MPLRSAPVTGTQEASQRIERADLAEQESAELAQEPSADILVRDAPLPQRWPATPSSMLCPGAAQDLAAPAMLPAAPTDPSNTLRTGATGGAASRNDTPFSAAESLRSCDTPVTISGNAAACCAVTPRGKSQPAMRVRLAAPSGAAAPVAGQCAHTAVSHGAAEKPLRSTSEPCGKAGLASGQQGDAQIAEACGVAALEQAQPQQVQQQQLPSELQELAQRLRMGHVGGPLDMLVGIDTLQCCSTLDLHGPAP